MLIFSSITDLPLALTNTNFNTYKMLIMSQSKTQFQFGTNSTKPDNVSYGTILYIKGIDWHALKHFKIKMEVNGEKMEMATKLKQKIASQTKKKR